MSKAPKLRTRAAELLLEASAIVDGPRDREHGAKEVNFQNIATLWQAYLSIRRDRNSPLKSEEVGHLMVLMKIARTQTGDLNIDDYVDAAGYAACAAQIAEGKK